MTTRLDLPTTIGRYKTGFEDTAKAIEQKGVTTTVEEMRKSALPPDAPLVPLSGKEPWGGFKTGLVGILNFWNQSKTGDAKALREKIAVLDTLASATPEVALAKLSDLQRGLAALDLKLSGALAEHFQDGAVDVAKGAAKTLFPLEPSGSFYRELEAAHAQYVQKEKDAEVVGFEDVVEEIGELMTQLSISLPVSQKPNMEALEFAMRQIDVTIGAVRGMSHVSVDDAFVNKLEASKAPLKALIDFATAHPDKEVGVSFTV